MLKNIDRLFEFPEFAAAPNVYERLGDFHRLNSGVFTARPAAATFAAMCARLTARTRSGGVPTRPFWRSPLPDWHGLPVFFNMLQYVWLNLPELWDWKAISVLHFQYEKPWQADHPKAAALKPLIELWHTVAAGDALPIASWPGPPAR